jgi:hypothetical protein
MSLNTRRFSILVGLASTAAMLLASSMQTSAQQQRWIQPKTPWGHPDLQGIWSAQGEDLTPLERPTCRAKPDVCNRQFLTDAEYQDLVTILDNRVAVAEGTGSDPTGLVTSRQQGLVGGVGAHIWYETTPSRPSKRTSKIVEPPDGRLPPYSPEGQKRNDAEDAQSLKARRERGGAAASAAFWAARRTPSWFVDAGIGLQMRCLSKSLPSAYFPNAYGANLQILQTRDAVVMVFEIYHEVRVIPLDGRPHIPSAVRDWMGDARGHWEGNTLVVEATNFRERVLLGGEPLVSDSYKVVERFTRVDENRINHQMTIIDPATWTKPITLEIDHYKDVKQTQIMEYACHEGNYDILNGLIGGIRATDAEANARQGSTPAVKDKE